MKFQLLVTAIVLLYLSATSYAELTHDNAAQQAIEEQAMVWLAQTRDNTEAITPFTTDGCSGGLSAGWQLLANSSQTFKNRYGEHPPWEACCVAHDRTYWRGETERGYHLRQQADAKLRACVIEEGKKQAPELAPVFETTPAEIEKKFNQAAELMYISVRLGGGPCSGLPWRWGYGWPQCGFSADTSPAQTQN